MEDTSYIPVSHLYMHGNFTQPLTLWNPYANHTSYDISGIVHRLGFLLYSLTYLTWIVLHIFNIQVNLSGTTTLDVKKRWSFQTGGYFREVRFAWNPMVGRHFQKLENGLSRQGGLSRGVVPDSFHCINIIFRVLPIKYNPGGRNT